jgi:hypothetical protein
MRKILYCLFIFYILTGCNKFVEVDAPPTSISSAELFTSDPGAIAAAAGMYSQLGSINLNLANGGVTVYAGLSADEIVNTAANNSFDAYRNNALLPTEGSLASRFWNPAYRSLYQVNAILEGLERSDGLSTTVRNQLRGEMLFVRAFLYFYLVNLFGDVPYITVTDYPVNAVMGRTPSAQVYAGITADLELARQLLKPTYPGPTKGRPNLWAATALLARVQLFQGRWAAAEAACTEVINSGQYSLASQLNQVFVLHSSETLWQLQRDNNNTGEGNAFVPSGANVRPNYALTATLINAFEPNDQRRNLWVQRNTVGSTQFSYPAKYRARTNAPITEAIVVLRLAEVYLIRAEARAQQQKTADGLADLNIIRSRAGLALAAATDAAQLLAAIMAERRVELFAEWGHRWLDLKRTGQADAVLQTLKGAQWQSTDVLYPIPLAELQKNPALTQNPGY